MIWKDVPGYERLYEVSDEGLIRNWETWQVLRPRKCKDGSYLVNLSYNGHKKTFALHKIVAMVHVPNPEGKRYVRFKDGNKENTSAENLYWTHAKSRARGDEVLK